MAWPFHIFLRKLATRRAVLSGPLGPAELRHRAGAAGTLSGQLPWPGPHSSLRLSLPGPAGEKGSKPICLSLPQAVSVLRQRPPHSLLAPKLTCLVGTRGSATISQPGKRSLPFLSLNLFRWFHQELVNHSLFITCPTVSGF